MESFRKAVTSVLNQFSKTVSIYIAVITICSYHVIFDKDLPCTCKDQLTDCSLYMILPAFLFVIVVLWLDKTFQRVCKFMLADCNGKFICIFFCQIFKALLVGLLWVISVLIDGDWYLCCFNDYYEQHPQLACKDEGQIESEEKTIIAELKNKSRVIGLPLLLVMTFVFALVSSIPWWKRCADRFDKNLLFDMIILEEAENLVTKRLRKAAKDKLIVKLNNYVNRGEWVKCFGVAEEVIKETSPKQSAESSPPEQSAESSSPEQDGLLAEQSAESSPPEQSAESSSPEQSAVSSSPEQSAVSSSPKQSAESSSPKQSAVSSSPKQSAESSSPKQSAVSSSPKQSAVSSSPKQSALHK